MQGDEDTWARLRRAYETTSEPLKEIAAGAGVTVQRLVARARKEGWAARAAAARERTCKRAPSGVGSTRSPPAGKADAAVIATPARRAGLPTRGTQRALVGRLFRAISLKLEHMEKRMASGEARSAQDEERESRALATLINNFEKVTEAGAELDKDRDTARATGTAGADAERMRREIAERLERLGGVGPARGRSRMPRS